MQSPAALTSFRGRAQLRGKSEVLHRFYCERGQSELDTLQIHAERNAQRSSEHASKKDTAESIEMACCASEARKVVFTFPTAAQCDARSNHSGNAAAPSNARRYPLHGRLCGTRPDLMLRRKDTPLPNCQVECVHISSKPCVAKRHTVQHLSQPNITRRRQCARLATRNLPQRMLVLRTLQAQTPCAQRRAQEQRKTLREQARCTSRRAQELHPGGKATTNRLHSSGHRRFAATVQPRSLELPHQLQSAGLSRFST